MLKWIFILTLGYIAYRYLVRATTLGKPDDGKVIGEDMIQCMQCGIHVPRTEAIVHDGRSFCGEAHLNAWRAAR